MPTRMTPSMHAHVCAQTARALEEAKQEFLRALQAKSVIPIATLSKTIKFEITTPVDGDREFVVVASLTEQSVPDHSPSPDHSIVTA